MRFGTRWPRSSPLDSLLLVYSQRCCSQRSPLHSNFHSRRYTELMATEGVQLTFEEAALRKIGACVHMTCSQGVASSRPRCIVQCIWSSILLTGHNLAGGFSCCLCRGEHNGRKHRSASPPHGMRSLSPFTNIEFHPPLQRQAFSLLVALVARKAWRVCIGGSPS